MSKRKIRQLSLASHNYINITAFFSAITAENANMSTEQYIYELSNFSENKKNTQHRTTIQFYKIDEK